MAGAAAAEGRKKAGRVRDSMFLNAESKVGSSHSYFLCEAGRQI